MSSNEYSTTKLQGTILNSNENYQNLNEEIRKEIAEAIYNLEFNRYPVNANPALLEAFSKYVNKPVSQIASGNGSDEMLGLMIGLNIKKDAKLYTFSLDFSMYDYYTFMYSGKMKKYDWKLGTDLDVDDFIKQGQDCDVVLFSNPNNPTGRVLDKATILKIVEGFKDKVVIIDEAYMEFSDQSVLDQVENYDNLFVTKTLSKAFGLASARVGFLIGNKEKMERVKDCEVPFNISQLNEAAAIIVLNHLDELEKEIAYIKEERERMSQCLTAKHNKFTFYSSNTNFFYAVSDNKEEIIKAFEDHNVVIRNYRNNSFRITIGTKEENDLVMNILKEVDEK